MENPLKDYRIRAALLFAAFSMGSAYLAIVHHVLIGRRIIGEVPATVGVVAGSIEAVFGFVVLWYAWKVYRRSAGRKSTKIVVRMTRR